MNLHPYKGARFCSYMRFSHFHGRDSLVSDNGVGTLTRGFKNEEKNESKDVTFRI